MPVQNALPFAFLLSVDRAGAPNLFCTTVVWPMMMEDFDVMFSGKSFYKSQKMMANESLMSALSLLVV